MIVPVTMYRAVCDRCGRGDDSGYWAWDDAGTAVEMWREDVGGEETAAGLMLCSGCWQWGPDDEEIEPIPGPFVQPGVMRR